MDMALRQWRGLNYCADATNDDISPSESINAFHAKCSNMLTQYNTKSTGNAAH